MVGFSILGGAILYYGNAGRNGENTIDGDAAPDPFDGSTHEPELDAEDFDDQDNKHGSRSWWRRADKAPVDDRIDF